MSPLSSREPDLNHMESGGNVNHVTHVSENVTCGAGLGQRDSAACWRREQTPDSWGRTRVSQTGSRTGQQVLHFIYALRVLLSGDTDEQYYNSFNLLTDCSYFAVSKHFNQRCLGNRISGRTDSAHLLGANLLSSPSVASFFIPFSLSFLSCPYPVRQEV